MTLTPISLGKGSNQSRFSHAGAARFINCYLEPQGENAKTPDIVVASDGLTAFAELATLGCRASLEVGGYLYAVFGRTLYRISETGDDVVLGGVPTSGPVYMVRNRRDNPQIGVVSDGKFYVYDTASGAFDTIAGPDAAFLPKSIAMLDGYGILPVTNSKWYITALDNLTDIDPLEFAKAESNPDEIKRAATREGDLVLFGDRSIEWYQDTGGADFPFTRSQAVELGCLAGASVANVDRTLVWVAHDGTVRVMQGYDGRPISNGAVERAIAAVDPSELSATTWWNYGHTFYALSSNSWTWVYDLKTGNWHERQSAQSSRWCVSHVARLGQRMIAGDVDTGQLYVMSPDAFAEASDELVMTVQTPPSHAHPYRLQFNALHIDVVPGVGLNTTVAQDLDPELMVQWSDNGGKTWSGERRVPLGRQGDYVRRGIVRRLGVSTPHGRTFKLSISAAVAKGLIGLAVDVNKLGA